MVDRRLIETGHRAERPRNEVQFVLDDQIGRPRVGRIPAMEKTRCLASPRQRRELVCRCDHERRQTGINRLVNRDDRQITLPCEVAAPAGAVHQQIGRFMPVERCAAPGALLERQRRFARRVACKPQGLRARCLVASVAPAAHIIWRRGAPDPQGNFKRPFAELFRRLLALEFERTDQRGCAAELVERQ